MLHRTARMTAIIVAATSTVASSQCVEGWVPGEGGVSLPRPNATTVWDPDGDGPAQPLFISVGQFNIVGDAQALNVAAWNGITWSGLGDGPGFIPRAVAVYEGDLVAAGDSRLGEPSAARWNGSTWTPMGNMIARRVSGFNDPGINTLAVHNGELYVAGDFTTAAGSPFNYIGRWNGTEWVGLPAAFNAAINVLHVHGNELVAGGTFTHIGTTRVSRIARWNGSQWTPMRYGFNSNADVNGITVRTLTTFDGRLIAGGNFFTADDQYVKGIATWNGATWSDLGQGVREGTRDGNVASLAVYDGSLIVGGNFTQAGSLPVNNIASWNGSAWSPLAQGIFRADSTLPAVDSMAVYSNRLLIGGPFLMSPSDVLPRGIMAWDGTAWSALTDGLDGNLTKFVEYEGELFGLGDLYRAGTNVAHGLVRWDGSAWQAMAEQPDNRVADAVVYQNELVVCGHFDNVGDLSAPSIARWNGKTWSTLGEGAGGYISRMIVWKGDLIASGSDFILADGEHFSGIARWNGVEWSQLAQAPSAPSEPYAQEMIIYQNELYAGLLYPGDSQSPAMTVLARFDGTSWQHIGSLSYLHGGTNEWTNGLVNDLAVYNDMIVIAGHFDRIGKLEYRNIAQWSLKSGFLPLGEGLAPRFYTEIGARTLEVHRGSLLAIGDFDTAGNVPVSGSARWNGVQWTTSIEGGDIRRAEDIISFGGDLFFSTSITDEQTGRYTAGYGRWRECCVADFNSDALVNSQDFFDFLTAFFANSPAADINEDGGVSSQDFFDFLGSFFDGC